MNWRDLVGSSDGAPLATLGHVYRALIPEGSAPRNVIRTLRLTKLYLGWAEKMGSALALHHPQTPGDGDLAGRRIVIFAYKFPWMDIAAAMAIGLAARGAEVRIAWLPYTWAHPLGRRTELLTRRIVAAAYRRAIPNTGAIRGIDLRSLPAAVATEEDERALSEIAKVDTHYLSRLERIGIGEGEPHHALYLFRRQRNIEAYRHARSLLARERFDSAIIPNGMVLEFASFVRACQAAQVDFTTFEFWERHTSCVVSLDRPVFDGIAETMWRHVPKTLTPEARTRVAKTMAQREGTDWKDFVLRYQHAPTMSEERLRAELQLDPAKPMVLVLPNVPFDTATFGNPGPFPTMRAWLEAVLRALRSRDDCQVVVRAHPAEFALGANETAEQIYRETLPNPPAHFRFLASEAKVNTYSLMNIAAMGLVFSSTTGLELALRGVPTLVATEVHYTRAGFTMNVKSEADLGSKIDALLRVPHRLPQDQVDLAWAYADMYANRWPRPFPFPLEPNFWQDSRVNVEAAKRDALPSDLRDTLTLLAGGPGAHALYEHISGKNLSSGEVRSRAPD